MADKRSQWDAYPVLTPTANFPPMVLDDGIYYVNGFETFVNPFPVTAFSLIVYFRFISTMETETVASRGVVDLLLKEKFGQGICPTGVNSNPPAGSDFIWGWDC